MTEKLLKSLGKNIEDGGTFHTWKKDIGEVINKEGLSENGWYWENVYRNAKMSSYNAGHWQQQQESKADFPYLLYDGVRDGREQEHTKAFDGLIFPVDHQFWLINYPPNGFFCRCGVISISKDEFIEEGYKVSRFTNKLKEIDNGTFNGNPGVSYLASIKSNVDDKQDRVNKIVEKTKSDISKQITDKLKNDLNLTRINLKSLNLNQLEIVDKEVRTFMKEYPNTKLDVIKTAKVKSNVGAYCQLKKNSKGIHEVTLAFNENYLNKYKSIEEMNQAIAKTFESGWWAPRDYNDIVRHELGHASTYSYMLKNIKFYNENRSKLEYNRIGKEVSEYGGTNGFEAIAEAFVAKRNGQKLSKNLLRFIKEWTGVDFNDN